MAYQGYRVVRLDHASIYGRVPVTRWISHGEAMTYWRYAQRSLTGRFAVESKRRVLQEVSA
jgi:hypothetical protein